MVWLDTQITLYKENEQQGKFWLLILFIHKLIDLINIWGSNWKVENEYSEVEIVKCFNNRLKLRTTNKSGK